MKTWQLITHPDTGFTDLVLQEISESSLPSWNAPAASVPQKPSITAPTRLDFTSGFDITCTVQ